MSSTHDVLQNASLNHLVGQPHWKGEIDKALNHGNAVQMRSSLDDMPITQAIRLYWRISLMCMAGAFCAAMDGYQVSIASSIVSNKGFIRQMSNGGTVLDPTHVSVWGGMQSTGQLIGVLLLQFASDPWGRKVAMHITWVTLVVAVALESAATNWLYWLFAKLIGGGGLGMMQATYPLWIAEHSPTQLRGFLINAYLFWYVVAQIFAPLALRQLAASDSYNFRIPIYTQWGMLGVLLIINVLVPESPWWLVQREKHDKAEKILASTHKDIPNYNAKDETAILIATVEHEKLVSEANKFLPYIEVFKGTNGWRLFIAFWPKAIQQLAGQSVTNNYATYFFQLAGNTQPFTVTIILAICQLVGIMTAAGVSDRFGRRWLTLGLFGAGAISILCIGILGSFDYTSSSLGSLLVFFACVSNFGVIGGASIAYSYVAEVPAARLKVRATTIALAGSYCLGLTFNYTVPLMLEVWSVKTGYFFGATGIISVVIAFFILPEVACRTPAEIDEMFEAKVAPRKFRTYVTQVQTNVDHKEHVTDGEEKA